MALEVLTAPYTSSPHQKTIFEPCGISQLCSVAELKGQQISTSTVFMLSGTETLLCQLSEFVWCHRDSFPPLTANLYINIHKRRRREGTLQVQETVMSSSFSCSAAA